MISRLLDKRFTSCAQNTDRMTDGNDTKEETQSTTFTYAPSTRRWLMATYPDALNLNQAIRMAIADARLVRGGDLALEGDTRKED